jgi:hypothetical protein
MLETTFKCGKPMKIDTMDGISYNKKEGDREQLHLANEVR